MFEMYCLYDKKTAHFEKPFPARHLVEVIRSIELHLKSGNEGFAMFPADFALYQLGSFDQNEGLFVQSKPVHKAEILDFVSKVPVSGGEK